MVGNKQPTNRVSVRITVEELVKSMESGNEFIQITDLYIPEDINWIIQWGGPKTPEVPKERIAIKGNGWVAPDTIDRYCKKYGGSALVQTVVVEPFSREDFIEKDDIGPSDYLFFEEQLQKRSGERPDTSDAGNLTRKILEFYQDPRNLRVMHALRQTVDDYVKTFKTPLAEALRVVQSDEKVYQDALEKTVFAVKIAEKGGYDKEKIGRIIVSSLLQDIADTQYDGRDSDLVDLRKIKPRLADPVTGEIDRKPLTPELGNYLLATRYNLPQEICTNVLHAYNHVNRTGASWNDPNLREAKIVALGNYSHAFAKVYAQEGVSPEMLKIDTEHVFNKIAKGEPTFASIAKHFGLRVKSAP